MPVDPGEFRMMKEISPARTRKDTDNRKLPTHGGIRLADS